ncbi:hypothetical protein FHK02_2456 [Spirosoma sp. LMG 31448]|uniref:Uncharacterized protein n=1 Tax=Spirosoma utsteinense TaxID=2585773 RepID=A0ABR6W248_9BACT|nr:hypothetical protein [Spirosoma utsteinense]MBC3790673.1 hypothetical protein [Spirosoma utsteinense]
MRQLLVVTILASGSLICFTGYCVALIDWVQDIENGTYWRNHLEAVLETFALFTYSYLAIRFMKSRFTHL